jgi:hypothetical protein
MTTAELTGYRYVIGRLFYGPGEDTDVGEQPEYLSKRRWVSDIRKAHVFKTRSGAEKAVTALRCGGKIVAIHPQYVSELFSEDNYAD